jgi:hypothetical protein
VPVCQGGVGSWELGVESWLVVLVLAVLAPVLQRCDSTMEPL